MKDYNFLEVEKKWQNYWVEHKTFKTDINSDKPKYYCLDMFPYPSGSGLHVGHPKGYTATDIMSRYKRLKGFSVMHPMGWDAFGLPAEQYAQKTNNHPGEFTNKNIDTFRKQIQSLGFSYDWDREVNTTEPEYYKWSQWIFIQLYKHGLAEVKEVPVNFCPECKAVLANEEVSDGLCERGHQVERKPMRQWVLKITKYADRLLKDLDKLDWPESLKDMQRNWIGKSSGAIIDFSIDNQEDIISVFTTKPYTIYGVSAVVIACEHPLVNKLVTKDNQEQVEAFIQKTVNQSDLQRSELNIEKLGIFTGSYVKHPFSGELLPVYIGDYVLPTFGTGAVMCAPSHDQRDFDFAKKYDLAFKQIQNGDPAQAIVSDEEVLINSDNLNGLTPVEANTKVISMLEQHGCGHEEVTFKLRDWIFSRQRYWGEPFPVLYDDEGNIHLVDEEDLPVKLPHLDQFLPGEDGQSPLVNATDWLNVEIDGKHYTRETNTMPQWAGSCWYYVRYLDPHNDQQLVDPQIAKKWLPVDLYIGGAEHAVLHLLYARFWFKFLYDIGVVPVDEPFMRLFNQGMILGEDNQKMSKSKGNVVNPDDIVKSHGADALRLYEMFMGPLDASVGWTEKGLNGAKKFIDRVWRMFDSVEVVYNQEELEVLLNQTIDKVEKDIENLSFNTAISQLMIFVNEVYQKQQMTKSQMERFIVIISPFIPHVAEELNLEVLGNNFSVNELTWPAVDASKLVANTVEVIVQVNGKIKSKLQIKRDLDKDSLYNLAKENVIDHLEGRDIIKEIVVVNKLVNFVVK